MKDPESKLVWESIDNPLFQLDERTLMVGSSWTSNMSC